MMLGYTEFEVLMGHQHKISVKYVEVQTAIQRRVKTIWVCNGILPVISTQYSTTQNKKMQGFSLCVLTQSCRTAYNSMDYSLPGSSIHGVSQQELPFPSPGNLPNPRIKPTFPCIAGRFITTMPLIINVLFQERRQSPAYSLKGDCQKTIQRYNLYLFQEIVKILLSPLQENIFYIRKLCFSASDWIYCCSVDQSSLILCDPMDCSIPGFPVLHQLLELTHTHIH